MPQTQVGYRLHPDEVLWVVEDPSLVLLGGEVWPASFVMGECLAAAAASLEAPAADLTVVELGAGAGLCGLVAGTALVHSNKARKVQVFLTDEAPALCELNKQAYLSTHPPSPSLSLHALELPWGEQESSLPPTLLDACRASTHVWVVGCEVTPMLQTQPLLLSTIHTLLSLSPKEAVAILTIDSCIEREEGGREGHSPTYPPTCPHAKACAGHRFLGLVDGWVGGWLEWVVVGRWSREEVKEICRRRRVGGWEEERGLAATAPEGLVIVHVRRRKRKEEEEEER